MTFLAIVEESEFSLVASEQLCRHLSLATIQSATQNFKDEFIIGLGGFGKVYKGYIDNGSSSSIAVAIKRLDSMSNQGASEFRAEIEMLSKLRHCNLVSLIGYCNDSREMILVYEYMPRGTLDFHLHEAVTPLSWVQRLKISIGAARGLDYLHTGSGTQHGVIHRDVKSSNILLDENWDARISDFGLSKIGPTNQPSSSFVNTCVKGTFGYIDPVYFLTGRLTRKSDVYAFGVVLFELLSGRRAVDTSLDEEPWSLARWAEACVKERNLDQIVDSRIKGQMSSKCLKEFALIAYRCLHSHSKERPTMAEVVVGLQLSLTLQEKFNNNSSQPAGKMGFTKKMQKYFVFPTKENSGRGDTKETRNDDKSINCNSMPTEDGDHDKVPLGSEQMLTQDLKVFSYNELKCATNNFQSQMRRGSPATSAWVFKGWLHKKTYSPSVPGNGLPIVVKRLRHCNCGNPEKAELDLKMLVEFNHPNLVKLIGYCLEGKELLLVYEFIHNGSIEAYLIPGTAAQLPLITRVKIAVGVARGLVFVHNTQDEASEWLFEKHNILLDEEFNAKLSDFDVAKLVHGHTFEDHSLECYYHPWRSPHRATSEIFCSEMVLLELLTDLQISTHCQLSNSKTLTDEILERPPQSVSIRLEAHPNLTTILKKLEQVYARMTDMNKSLLQPHSSSLYKDNEHL